MAKGNNNKKRYFKRKGRWSSNIVKFSNQSFTNTQTEFFAYYTLCSNPAQSTTTVSQQYTVKNFAINYEITSETDTVDLDNLCAFILYIPQGFNISVNTPYEHPEWILAMRYYGNISTENNIYRNPLSIRTRMARRLQTGDQIVLFISGHDTAGVTAGNTNFFRGIVRWNSKAN